MKVRDLPEYVNLKEQNRNEKCACGSGLKYKKCCGKPKKMDLTTFYKGRVLDFVLYEGQDKEEMTKIHGLTKACLDNDFPLCLPGVKYDIKVLNTEVETLGEGTEYPLYSVSVKGEIL